jgi:hypothetical protein
MGNAARVAALMAVVAATGCAGARPQGTAPAVLAAQGAPVAPPASAAATVPEEAPGVLVAGALPPARLDLPAPLMKALKDRHSERNYSDRKLSIQQVADILWAANGVNREDGRRTSPSAMNKQGVDIYAVTADGAFLYDPVKHALVAVAPGDLRKEMGGQEFVAVAGLNLAYVADNEVVKDEWAAVAVGCMAQNVGLYCATAGLGNVVRGWFEADKVKKALSLQTNQSVILTQTVGSPK